MCGHTRRKVLKPGSVCVAVVLKLVIRAGRNVGVIEGLLLTVGVKNRGVYSFILPRHTLCIIMRFAVKLKTSCEV